MAARDSEAEAAREILAARFYEQQAEQYQAQAPGITPAGAGAGGPVLDDRRKIAGHYAGARGRVLQGIATDDTGKEAMTASAGTDGAALPDAAGLTVSGAGHWHGSDVVTAASGDGTVSLGLCRYPDSAAYVVVATNPANTSWAPDSNANGSDPALDKQEAGQLADALDELVALAESGAQTTAATELEKVAARVRQLLGGSGVRIVGDAGEIEVSAADIRTILDAAAPESAVATRRKVDAKACGTDGMDTGALWAELDTSGPEPVIAVTSTEGEAPEDYPQGSTTTRLSPAEASVLAAKVRRFANAEVGGAVAQPNESLSGQRAGWYSAAGDAPLPRGASPAAVVWAVGQRRGPAGPSVAW